MKKCSLCKIEKGIDQFAKKGKGKQPHCKECQKIKIREWYSKNKARQLENTKKSKRKVTAELRELKSGPCKDCGVQYPYYVMDFDHREDEVKLGLVSKMINSGSKTAALEEIAKCDLVCSNCHRERTYQRIVKPRSRPVV
jgi:hypothetical protein